MSGIKKIVPLLQVAAYNWSCILKWNSRQNATKALFVIEKKCRSTSATIRKESNGGMLLKLSSIWMHG